MSVSRRNFLAATAATAAASLLEPGALLAANASPEPKRFRLILFEKTVEDLAFEELAGLLADLGFDGVEATIRKGGHVSPERAVDELPAYVAALAKHGLRMDVMATSISRADQPHAEATLRAAAKLGIKTYRLDGVSYAPDRPLKAQLDALRPAWRDLAALNHELGLTGVYQNHAGARHVGGPVWDLDYLLDDISPDDLGIAYDIRHAMVEGSSAWPLSFRLILPRVRAVYVKDFKFDGAKAVNVPMGEGVVGREFYELLKSTDYRGPISLHVPYLNPKGREASLAAGPAIGRDLAVLKRLVE